MDENISQITEFFKKPLKEQIIFLAGTAVAWGWIIGLLTTCVLPIYQQIMAWLKTGIVPERDLYWVFAGTSCAATNWEARGFEGMEICRPDHINFTNWVGVDQMLNWFYDWHIGLVFLLVSILMFAAFLKIWDEFIYSSYSPPAP